MTLPDRPTSRPLEVALLASVFVVAAKYFLQPAQNDIACPMGWLSYPPSPQKTRQAVNHKGNLLNVKRACRARQTGLFASSPAALTLAQIAACFGGSAGLKKSLPTLLQTLAALGRAQQIQLDGTTIWRA